MNVALTLRSSTELSVYEKVLTFRLKDTFRFSDVVALGLEDFIGYALLPPLYLTFQLSQHSCCSA